MQRTLTTTFAGLVILFASGCRESAEPTTFENPALSLADTTAMASLGGTIVDLDSLPVAHARVFLHFVGPLPPDTTPPDTAPPDTVPPPPDSTGRSAIVTPLPVVLAWSDSIPGDTVPPPPPPQRCGDRGQEVARARSNRNGVFQFSGLAPGVYDVRAVAPGERGAFCGALVRSGQSVQVTIMLTGRAGMAAGR
jgi:hypothetical protein